MEKPRTVPIKPWRIAVWRCMAVAIPCAFLAGDIALSLHAPRWAQLASGIAILVGFAAGAWVNRSGDQSWANRWYVWALVGVSGPLLAKAPDRYMAVFMSFLTGAVTTVIVVAERQRWRDARADHDQG